jgi:tetratricopeptide (TPR) repeat protein
MNFFEKIFGTKAKPESAPANKLPNEESVIETTIQIKTLFCGIDEEFVNLIYFKDDNERLEYLAKIELFLKRVGISNESDFTEVIDKIVKDENDNPEEEIDFTRQVFLFRDFLCMVRNGKESIEPSNTFRDIGYSKITKYYKGLDFATKNVERKIARDFFDFAFEDKLIGDLLNDSDLFNYARIDSLCYMGLAHFKAGNPGKAVNYFNQILSELDSYDLSPVTVSEFLRNIGDYYLEVENYSNALKYYELGLQKNPKLGVKKKILELKQKTGNG